MNTPALRDFHAAMRWLERHLAVLEVRREYAKVDALQRRMREAEGLSVHESRLSGLFTIAVSEGFEPAAGAA